MTAELHLGDCLEVMKGIPDGSADAVVTDPPAGISMMSKSWDSDRGGRDQWIGWLAARLAEARRCLKPGGYALVWALPRTSHWTALAIEDAGYEIRDRIGHLFGQGFPKGKGCLKPSVEDWYLARKPGPKVLPLGIDECRVPTDEKYSGSGRPGKNFDDDAYSWPGLPNPQHPAGRWPSHLTHDGSPEVLAMFAEFGDRHRGEHPANRSGMGYSGSPNGTKGDRVVLDTGTVARYFYAAKASPADRNEGNTHPTVKSTALMSWLVKLVCPPGGVTLDLFMGSGSTGKACLQTGRRFIGIDDHPPYFEIARRRLSPPADLPLFVADATA